ncbi:hypothetical protein HDU97_004219 [Phlyctochytrium planicorne]|nr:hypothetical protein HDU97_004219 [Phlyctochytrium planicorne]
MQVTKSHEPAEVINCSVVNRKTSGKLERETIALRLSNGVVISTSSAKKADEPQLPKPAPAAPVFLKYILVITANRFIKTPAFEDLSFNLSLTDDQKNARANISLPFGQKSGTSAIVFEAEAFDDDEYDPDDDLNV